MTVMPADRSTSRHEPARPDLIAPGSALYTMLCDATLMIYGLPLFLLPLLHPATSDATFHYDPVVADPDAGLDRYAGRMWATIAMVSGTVYAGPEATHVRYAMRELHKGTKGTLESGESYHAWSRDIWRWNWAAISAAILDTYATFRGFPSEQFGDDAYQGLVEIGTTFGVLGMPDTRAEFASWWPLERDRIAELSPAIHRIMGVTRRADLRPPHALRFLPRPLWTLMGAPIRHFMRVSVRAGVPRHLHPDLGLVHDRRDAVLLRVHRAAWRVVPRRATHEVGRLALAAHARFGTPVWRTRYSSAGLAGRAHRPSAE